MDSAPMPSLTNRTLYQCSKCKKVLKSRQSLRNHLNITHGDERKFACTICEKAFKHHANLINHNKAFHLKQSIVNCHVCHREFSSRGNLKKHLIRHVSSKTELESVWDTFYPLATVPKKEKKQADSVECSTVLVPVSKVEDLASTKFSRFTRLRLGQLLYPTFLKFDRGALFPIREKNIFACWNGHEMEPHLYPVQQNTQMEVDGESTRFCDICEKEIPDLSSHLALHHKTLSSVFPSCTKNLGDLRELFFSFSSFFCS